MDTNPVLHSLRRASFLLNEADHELFRPETDSVMLCACQSIKQAVKTFLKTYITENSGDASSDSIAELLSDCQRLNPTFNSIQLNSFECGSDKHCEGYCLDVEKVRQCFTEAKLLEEFILQRMNISVEEIYHTW